jgi:ribosome-binding factor A
VIYWSILGTPGEKSKAARALEDARGYLQSAIAREMGTRVTPRITLKYDESIEKAQKVHGILANLRKEREARGEESADESE